MSAASRSSIGLPATGTSAVAYGTLSDEPTLRPQYHQFVGSKAPWYEILDALPQHDTRDRRRDHLTSYSVRGHSGTLAQSTF